MASTKVKLHQLDKKTNFMLWQVKMKSVLTQLDLEDAVSPTMHISWIEDQMKMINQKRQKLTSYGQGLRRYVAKIVTRRNLAKQRLFGLHMMKGTSLESHLAAFKDIMAELEALDVNMLNDEDLCSLLLMSLSPSFLGFRDILFYGSEGLSLATIYEALSSKKNMSKFLETATSSQAEGVVI
ncbi:unnamed protein product [Spirodela intermedia]|uniref:Uncharacterized protein n=1 Tax=Spirodela intermedia TaxID=51605 RepID=A0A7I8KYW3_SPIIN|nr:unnamed protein product [Spirodela intermedia]